MPWCRRSSVVAFGAGVVALSAVVALLAGCAYVRPPKPPTLGIPVKIVALSAVERGSDLVVEFLAPAETTDKAVLKVLPQFDLRAGPEGPNWEATARRIEVPAAEPGPVHVKVPAAPWVGQSIELRVRAAGKHGRFGQWSDAVRFKVVPPLAKPALKVEEALHAVRLSWPAAPGADFRVYRIAPPEPQPSLAATVKTPEYIDSQIQYGKTYVYSVQAVMASGNSEAQSEVSGSISIMPEGRFPPPVPEGLAGIAGVSSIELTWNPDNDTDFGGYYLYRSVNGGAFERIGELLAAPVYSDHAIETGKHYRYQVSAVNRRGDESAKSPIVEMVAP
jgi:predicted phage tail protein